MSQNFFLRKFFDFLEVENSKEKKVENLTNLKIENLFVSTTDN